MSDLSSPAATVNLTGIRSLIRNGLPDIGHLVLVSGFLASSGFA
jgi:hypothetical protein